MAMTKATKPTKRDNHRVERVQSRVQQELSTLLQREFSDPRLAGVVLSHVAITDDLSLATVSFVVMGDGPDRAQARDAAKVLKRLAPAIRTKLAPRIDIRRAPEVEFVVDEGREQVERLDAILDEVSRELKNTRNT